MVFWLMSGIKITLWFYNTKRRHTAVGFRLWYKTKPQRFNMYDLWLYHLNVLMYKLRGHTILCSKITLDMTDSCRTVYLTFWLLLVIICRYPFTVCGRRVPGLRFGKNGKHLLRYAAPRRALKKLGPLIQFCFLPFYYCQANTRDL